MKNSCVKCRIAINIEPFLLSVIFTRIRDVIVKSQIFRVFGTRNSSLFWTGLIADGKSEYFTVCLDLEVVPVVFVKQKYQSDEWIFSPLNHRNGKRHLARNIYPSREKPHTQYTRNLRCPTFIFITHFTPKRKLTTFLKERGKISSRRFEGQSTTHVTECTGMI
jgi:hypothetical protein